MRYPTIDALEVYMPRFIGIYRQDEVAGKPWPSSLLQAHIATLLRQKVSCASRRRQTSKTTLPRTFFVNQHEATSHGINDDSGHWHDEDVYWDEESVTRDDQPRYDTQHEAYGMYGTP
jgi:hypothetical protein